MVKQPITRREFIGTSAVAGAGLLLTSCSPDSGQKAVAPKSSLSKINVALIGLGAEGTVLSESLMNIDGIQLVAVCDVWQ
jgi:hypothetical protein